MALNQWYEWRCVDGRGIDSDLRSIFTIFGAALAFELLLILLVFSVHRLGRLVLMTIAAISLPLLFTIEILDTLGLSDLFLEGFLPLALWTAVFATLTILISARLDRTPSPVSH